MGIHTTSLYYEFNVGFVLRNWFWTDTRDGRRERQRERRIHKLKTSWFLEYLQKEYNFALTFEVTEGSMLGRREWFDAVLKRFDAGKKGMIRC